MVCFLLSKLLCARLTILDGHYLNLPVMSDAGEIVGMVDVLKLTYATLDQVSQSWAMTLFKANYHLDQQHRHTG
jgi:hypothetical protein